jgi:hypothetical protein
LSLFLSHSTDHPGKIRARFATRDTVRPGGAGLHRLAGVLLVSHERVEFLDGAGQFVQAAV